MRIEWYPDECAQMLPKVQYLPRKENAAVSAKKLNPMVNRFQMLNIDGTEDGSEDEADEDLTGFTSIGRGSNWNAPTVTA